MSDFSDRFQNFPEEPSFLFPLPEIRTLYESEKICKICSCKFDIPSLSHTKKCHCFFCYHAACARCLTFDYYHTDLKSMRPMCPICYHQLTTLSEDFALELENNRLERIELKKGIKIALSEKAQAIRERQMISEKLKILTENSALTIKEQESTLEQLKKKKKEVKDRISELAQKSDDSGFKFQLLSQRFQGLRAFIVKFKKEKEQESKECEKIRDEYNGMISRIAFLKHEISKEEPNEGDISYKADDLPNEFEALNGKIKETIKKNRKTEKKLEKLKKSIQENNLYIDELMGKLKDTHKQGSYELTPEECYNLLEIQRRLSELNDIIKAISERKQLICLKMEKKSVGHLEMRENYLLDQNEYPSSRLSYQVLSPSSPKSQKAAKNSKNPTKNNTLTVPKPTKSMKNSKKSDISEETDSKSRGCDLCSNCSIIQ